MHGVFAMSTALCTCIEYCQRTWTSKLILPKQSPLDLAHKIEAFHPRERPLIFTTMTVDDDSASASSSPSKDSVRPEERKKKEDGDGLLESSEDEGGSGTKGGGRGDEGAKSNKDDVRLHPKKTRH